MQPNEQHPEQPRQPESSPQGQAASSSSMNRVIQPLSSEDSILGEAQTTLAEHSVQNDSSVQPYTASPVVGQGDTHELGGLITEPIRKPQSEVQQRAIQSQAQLAPIPQKQRKRFPVAVMGVALLASLAAAYYFFFFGKISAADLAKETSGSTVYLRPKQWEAMPDLAGQGMTAYGDMKGDKTKAKLTSLVMLKEVPAIGGVTNPGDEFITQLRRQLLSQVSTAQLNPVGAAGSVLCDSASSLTPEEDTKKTATTTGLIASSSTCESKGKRVTTKIRVVIGKDGITRALTIMARDESWAKNKKVFESMLDSIEQAR